VIRHLLILIFTSVLVGCANHPPKKLGNICDIFDDKSGWYTHARRAQDKWGSNVSVIMSILHQESRFVHNARPARTKILWIFPGPRKSNAFGFAQVKTETWNEYQRNTDNSWGRRDRFKDAVDFVGWYNRQSQARSKIAVNDTYNLYLAYHEGHGGFNRGTYKNKAWLQSTARQVANRANQYASQLAVCEKRLQRSWWWPF
jgi:hypothetical protein